MKQAPDPPEDGTERRRMAVFLTDQQVEKLREIATRRMSNPTQTSAWLLQRGFDWWDGLPEDQKR